MWPFWRSYVLCKQAIVNTKTGKAFQGVIWARKGEYLVLRDTELLRGRGERLSVDGEVVVPLSNIEFIQLVGRDGSGA